MHCHDTQEINFEEWLDKFKAYFMREAGLEYQPYETWVDTMWNAQDVCLYNDNYYVSLIDQNLETPEVPEAWGLLTVPYDQSIGTYPAGSIVTYEGKIYKATKDTAALPSCRTDWVVVNPKTEWPNARPWAAPKAYKEGDKVVSFVKFKPGVWVSNMNDNYTRPGAGDKVEDTDVDTWERDEDETLDDVILDADILRAMGEASFKFNMRLFPKNRQEVIFLYLTMFFLVYDRQAAASGMNGNSAAGPVIHRTVGKMSVTYMESTLYKSNPSYEFLSSNEYGKKAYNLMAPYLRGGVRFFAGANTGD